MPQTALLIFAVGPCGRQEGHVSWQTMSSGHRHCHTCSSPWGRGPSCALTDNMAFSELGLVCLLRVGRRANGGPKGRDKDVCTCNVTVAVLGQLSPMLLLLNICFSDTPWITGSIFCIMTCNTHTLTIKMKVSCICTHLIMNNAYSSILLYSIPDYIILSLKKC